MAVVHDDKKGRQGVEVTGRLRVPSVLVPFLNSSNFTISAQKVARIQDGEPSFGLWYANSFDCSSQAIEDDGVAEIAFLLEFPKIVFAKRTTSTWMYQVNFGLLASGIIFEASSSRFAAASRRTVDRKKLADKTKVKGADRRSVA